MNFDWFCYHAYMSSESVMETCVDGDLGDT